MSRKSNPPATMDPGLNPYQDGYDLTEQQRRFCELLATGEYTNGGAWLATGHKCANEVVAQKAASRFLGTNEDGQRYIAALRALRVQSAVLTIEEKRERLARIVRATPLEVTPHSDIAEEYEDDGKKVKVKMPSKIRAMELDSKLAGHLAPEKVEVAGMEQLLALMAEIRSQKTE